MKILGPDNKPLFIDGVPQFAERTCGECARLRELDELTGACRFRCGSWADRHAHETRTSRLRGASAL